LVGTAPSFLQSVEKVSLVASTNATVLILGETGTGKELIARSIHYLSPRARYPFVAVNCGSLPDTLFEGELFGHERGAFTDAHARRPGLVAQARGGTLFLDELESLSQRGQVCILRLLQERTFRALGASSEQQVNVRFLAAANVPLHERLSAGGFRSDLYYRLSGVCHLAPVPSRTTERHRSAGPVLHRQACAAQSCHAGPFGCGDSGAPRVRLAGQRPGTRERNVPRGASNHNRACRGEGHGVRAAGALSGTRRHGHQRIP
jgi:transcriptional regulator with AAA-type ATPase domain